MGFRPFIYRLASERGLAGCVANNRNGAVIEIEGPLSVVDAFEKDLARRLPPLAHIAELLRCDIDVLGDTSFCISQSERDEGNRPEVTPDAATCRDCLTELFDAQDRRHRYPFINCTNCGPRYSIIRTVPYDRPATPMAESVMCQPCQREYTTPTDRRFHAQPNACAVCGPELRLDPPDPRSTDADPIRRAARMLSAGKVLAVKGIGGYHLACRADRDDVVQRLRQRKLRDGEPLAIMVPDVQTARRVCRLTPQDVEILSSPAAPIVLAPKNTDHGLAPSVALELLERVFVHADAAWRALGVIPQSGFKLAPAYQHLDALRRFNVELGEDEDHPACRCGEVIQGKTQPDQCALFASQCTPLSPVGPCMVSSEGTCAAWYKYHRATTSETAL